MISSLDSASSLVASTGGRETRALSTTEEGKYVTIAGLFDFGGFTWGAELFDFTVRLINDHEDGWFDDVLEGVYLNYTLSDEACDERVAVRAYLDLTRSDSPPHGIVGCRCSAPTKDVAFLASYDNLPVVSPSASTPVLSNKEFYPLFSRLLPADDKTGEVGALVTLLRSFGWDRISIINTDNDYTTDLVTQLKGAWEGQQQYGDDVFKGVIGYTGTVKLKTINGSEQIDPGSVEHVLKNVPVDNPAINSRVIVLAAHHQHAYPIIKMAQEMNIQDDTIWVGLNGWAGQLPPDMDLSWTPPVPGYIGIAPYRDYDGHVFQDFWARLQADQRHHGRPVMEVLPYWAFEKTVDSILALAMALSNVSPDENTRNGTAVVHELRKLNFTGASGPVSFNENGDRANPRFEVLNMRNASEGWVPIGTLVPGGPVDIDFGKICYAKLGCVVSLYIPSDKYDVPWPLPVLIGFIVLMVVAFMLFVTAFLYIRETSRSRPFKEQLRLLEEELRGIDSEGQAVQQRKGKLYHQIASLLDQPTPKYWTDAHGLVPVPSTSSEYGRVLQKMRSTMNDDETCHITALHRVQNAGIWSYYVFRKNQLANKYGVDINDSETLKEVDVWHGTSSLNPDVIYKDMQEGFMVNYAQQGMYGRGIYFAERAGYADCYSYRVDGVGAPDDTSSTHTRSEREMFLVKLLVGKAAQLNHHESDDMAKVCRSLVAPPPQEGADVLKYDAVSGIGDAEYKTKVQ
jgi:ABC-type branched-subunit amino acid transport system substrate-binding protein